MNATVNLPLEEYNELSRRADEFDKVEKSYGVFIGSRWEEVDGEYYEVKKLITLSENEVITTLTEISKQSEENKQLEENKKSGKVYYVVTLFAFIIGYLIGHVIDGLL